MSSLKLQQGASAAELSAVGQLVMLTQRIGKSANEFLTMEGVSPEAVFLLGKDLNSFREIAEGLNAGNPELRLPGTRDPQTKETLQQLLKQYEETRTPGQRHPGQPAGPGRRARGAERRSSTDSEPLRRGLDTLQERLAGAGGLSPLYLLGGVLTLALLVLSGLGLLRLFVFDQTRRSPRGRGAAPRGRAPGAGGQARQRRQPGRHSCA